MFKFFRRIRQQLLTENKLSKYLLYAVGEIFLVVIGILIALSINNWNEARKEQSQIQKYLIGLREAIHDDLDYLTYTRIGNIYRSECLKYLLVLATGESPKSVPQIKREQNVTYIGNRPGLEWDTIWPGPVPKTFDRDFTETCFKRTSYGNVIVVNQSTLEEFKNTGLFSNIKNEELKQSINEYYSSMNWHFSYWREENYRGEIDEWEDFLRDNYRINTSDISTISDPIGLIRENKDLQLEIEELALDAAGRANSAGEILLTAKELVIDIEEELLKM